MTGTLLARIATRVASVTVAILVAFALPLGGVQTQRVELHCCCPSLARCKCPTHDARPATQTTMEKCHRTIESFSTAPIPAFVPPRFAMVDVAVIRLAVVHVPLADPHAAPPPRRPDAPS